MKYNNEINLLKIYDNDIEFIHKLLLYSFNICLKQVDTHGNSLLHKMIMSNDDIGLEYIFKYINKLDNNHKKYLINLQNKNADAPIHIAILNNKQDIAKKLDDMGADMNLSNKDGYVPKITNDTETEINKFNKTDELDFELTTLTETIINNHNKSCNKKIMTPINENNKSDMTISTDSFFKFISNNNIKQYGGENIIINGTRTLNTNNTTDSYSDYSSITSDSLGINNIINNQDGGKNKKASDIHKEVVELIMEMGYGDEDARYIKAGLYNDIKIKFEKFSNYEKAKKLKDLTNKENVKKQATNLSKLKELVMKARENKKKTSNNNNEKTIKKSKVSKEKSKESKDKKTLDSKEKKKTKK